ncbi:acyl carrier protein [Streptomyces cupreus]|uniref:Acyl carrier protein n=1 Tax=Streptomyces cupreus TaxID=2759956 RepID=A0A7X1J3T3_9ACTN|nr:acyl carrier protein [Streptomyces cupreus]MBC2903701.1 acyl carrier protein [Streptomyces cupreus]
MTAAEGVHMPADVRAEKIRGIVCDILEIDPADMTPTSLFKEEHEADSLRAIEILAALERNFSVVIDQTELSRMVNLEGVCAVVTDALERT